METVYCSICGNRISTSGPYGIGTNNAQPINDGRCCDRCNNLVLARRINDTLREDLKPKPVKEKDYMRNEPESDALFLGARMALAAAKRTRAYLDKDGVPVKEIWAFREALQEAIELLSEILKDARSTCKTKGKAPR